MSAKTTRNEHMTKRCGHGPSDMCDFCLVAFDDHRGGGQRKRGHTLEGVYFVCAACPLPMSGAKPRRTP